MNICVEVRKIDNKELLLKWAKLQQHIFEADFMIQSILPIALNELPSMWEAISVRLLELMAYVSDAMEDILDMDMVSNFISAAMLLKELDSIADDIIACWVEEEKEDDSSIMRISFFIVMDELTDDDDSLWLIIIDPDEAGDGKFT